MPEGCPEKLDFQFMKYIWHFPKKSGRRNFERIERCSDKYIIVFKKRSEVNKYIKEIANRKN